LNEDLERITAVMNGLRRLSHDDLLIFAACAVVERMDKAVPEGYTLQTYAKRMILKGTELGKISQAKNNAAKKLANDPKQKEKNFVHECWQEWQRKPLQYSSKAAFARDMIEKCEHLESHKRIEDWCREWQEKHSSS
jgi:hypothetical protein